VGRREGGRWEGGAITAVFKRVKSIFHIDHDQVVLLTTAEISQIFSPNQDHTFLRDMLGVELNSY
jgi:hypothetical protein